MDLTARRYFNDFGMAEARAVSVSLAKRRCSWMAIRSFARHRSRMVVAQAFVDKFLDYSLGMKRHFLYAARTNVNKVVTEKPLGLVPQERHFALVEVCLFQPKRL